MPKYFALSKNMMSGMRDSKLQANIDGAITMAIGMVVQRVFDRSQELVPVRTGHLKNSGKIWGAKGGYTIEYSAPYALDVEFGTKGTSETYTSVIAPHLRKTKSGGRVNVKGHKKTYTGYKPIQQQDGTWRTINVSQPSQGTNFLGTALREVFGRALKRQNGLSIIAKIKQFFKA